MYIDENPESTGFQVIDYNCRQADLEIKTDTDELMQAYDVVGPSIFLSTSFLNNCHLRGNFLRQNLRLHRRCRDNVSLNNVSLNEHSWLLRPLHYSFPWTNHL